MFRQNYLQSNQISSFEVIPFQTNYVQTNILDSFFVKVTSFKITMFKHLVEDFGCDRQQLETRGVKLLWKLMPIWHVKHFCDINVKSELTLILVIIPYIVYQFFALFLFFGTCLWPLIILKSQAIFQYCCSNVAKLWSLL